MENSGFKNYNGRAKITQRFFEERFAVAGNISLIHRNNSFSFPQAFKYAKIFNPTAPVSYSNGSGYFEYIVFDSYNPEAMIQQNIHDGTTKIYRYGINLSYEITGSFQVKGGFSSESQKNEIRRYYSKESNWMGENRNGYREQEEQTLTTNFGFVSANFSKNINKTIIDLSGGLSFQNLDFNENYISAANFQTDAEGKASFINPNNLGLGYYFTKNHGITTYRGTFSSNTAEQLFISANLSHETYSDHMKGTTFGMGLAYDLTAKNKTSFKSLKPKVGFGKSSGALAFYQNYNPRNLIQSWRSLSNDPIKPEHKTEFTGGIDWALGKIGGSVNVFNATTKDVLILNYELNQDNTFAITFVNQARIRNSGIEIDLYWDVVSKENFQLQTSFNFSSIKNTFFTDEILTDYQPLEFILARGSTNLYSLQNNKPVGQFIGYALDGIVDNQWQLKDEDQDGEDDRTTFGRPLPVSFLGWTTTLKKGRWSAGVLFRGAFGHSLFNSTRLGYENPAFIQTYNVTSSVLKPPLNTIQDANYTSAFYLEDATYFKLDNLGVSYELFRSSDRPFRCSLNFAVQNLFVITNYSGTTPEVRLDYEGSQYAAGFDSQYTYSESRTFLAGIHFKL